MRVAFDIDGTLQFQHSVNGGPPKDIIDQNVMNMLLWFVENGDTVYVWSGSGMDYALRFVDEVALSDFSDVIVIPKTEEVAKEYKIDLTFDDMEIKLGKVNIWVRRE